MRKLFLVSFLLLSLFSSAQDTIKLNDVTVSSSRFKKTSLTSTQVVLDSVTIMGQETPEVLARLSPSIFSQSDNGTPFGYSYFSLRGVGQNRIQYSINGVPINEGEDLAVYTTNMTDLFSNLTSLELLRGASISSSGNASFVGGLEMVSKSPFSERGGEVSGMYGSYNSYRASASYNTGEIPPGFGATLRVSTTGSDGYRDNSWGKSQSLYFSMGYRKGRHILKFNTFIGNTRNDQSWLPVPEGMNPRTNLLTVGYPQQPDHFLQSINQLQYSYQISDNWALNISPYINTINGNYDFALDSATLGNLALKSINPGMFFNVKYDKNNFDFIFGGNGNYYQRSHIFSIRPFTENHIYDNYGGKTDFNIYARGTYLVVKHFRINGDVQYRNVSLTYHGDNLTTNLYTYNFFNYSGGVSFPFSIKSNNFESYMTFSQVSREQTRTDMLGYYDNLDSVAEITHFKPETNRDLEFGVKFKNNIFDIKLNGFYMNVRNEIIGNQLNYLGIQLGQNANKTQRVGLELESNYHWKFLIGGINFSYQDSKVWITNNDVEIPLLSPKEILTLHQGFVYKKFKAELSYQFVSTSFLATTPTYNSALILPSVNLLNLNLGYTYKSITFDVLVYNLTNKNQTFSGNYTTTRNFFYSSGISAYGSVKIKF